MLTRKQLIAREVLLALDGPCWGCDIGRGETWT